MFRFIFAIGLIFFVLWLLGLITSFTFGGGIHVLLVISVILIIIWLFFGRRSPK